MARVEQTALTGFCAALFEAAGAPGEVAGTVAESLVYAEARGVASHGVVRTEIYLRRLREGMVQVAAAARVERRFGATALVDGANSYGAPVGCAAMAVALELAAAEGVGVVGVRRSNHFGMAGYYLEPALAQGHAAIALTNASQTMAPAGGTRPFFGTNPLAIGFPTGGQAPFLLDMATSVVARGKMMVAAKNGEPIPEGWALDNQGRPTRDAQAGLDGTVLPLGGPKGSGLAMAIDVFCGVLTGAGFGPGVHNMYKDWADPQDVGHFFIVIDIERFLPRALFAERIDSYIAALKAEPRAPGVEEILVAGEPEHRRAQEARRLGVAVADPVLDDLRRLGAELGVERQLPAG